MAATPSRMAKTSTAFSAGAGPAASAQPLVLLGVVSGGRGAGGGGGTEGMSGDVAAEGTGCGTQVLSPFTIAHTPDVVPSMKQVVPTSSTRQPARRGGATSACASATKPVTRRRATTRRRGFMVFGNAGFRRCIDRLRRTRPEPDRVAEHLGLRQAASRGPGRSSLGPRRSGGRSNPVDRQQPREMVHRVPLRRAEHHPRRGKRRGRGRVPRGRGGMRGNPAPAR